jgi:hypothetical protein
MFGSTVTLPSQGLILAADQHGAEWSRSETDGVLDVAAPEADVGQRAVVEHSQLANTAPPTQVRDDGRVQVPGFCSEPARAGAANFEFDRRGAELWTMVHSHGGLLRAKPLVRRRFELAGLLRDLSFSSRSASRDLSGAAQKMPPFAQVGRAIQPFARIDPPC